VLDLAQPSRSQLGQLVGQPGVLLTAALLRGIERQRASRLGDFLLAPLVDRQGDPQAERHRERRSKVVEGQHAADAPRGIDDPGKPVAEASG